MFILQQEMTKEELCSLIGEYFDDMIKGVVDIDKEILAVNAELHADIEAMLIEQGSKQENLWGINLYPEMENEDDFLEFDSLINIRPRQGNRSRGIEDADICEKVRNVVMRWVR